MVRLVGLSLDVVAKRLRVLAPAPNTFSHGAALMVVSRRIRFQVVAIVTPPVIEDPRCLFDAAAILHTT